MSVEKRHIVLAALVVALGAAVYINWQFSGDQAITTTASQSSGVLGEAQYVNNPSTVSSGLLEASSGTDSATSSSGASSSDGKMSSKAEEYFTQAKLERQESRDKSIELLNSVINNDKATEEEKKEAVASASEIAKNIEVETKIESLIKAKNFAECMAFIENGKANIIVSTDGLLPHDTITINEIVNTQTDIPFKDITIVEVK